MNHSKLIYKFRNLLFCGFLAFAFSSCSSLQEVPNALNMPLPAQRHDMKASISVGYGGLALQASYAIDSHLVLTSSTQWNYNLLTSVDADGGPISAYHKELLEDIGVGYYKKLSDYTRFEVIGGLGLSFTRYNSSYESLDLAGDSYYNDYYTGNIIHAFAQADWGFVHRSFALALGIRFSERDYTGVYENYRDINHGATNIYLDNFYKSGIFDFYVEPGLNASFGSGNLKYNIMLGFSFSTSGFNLNPYILPNVSLPIYLSTGFTYALSGK
jgi:hypothetical protein